MTRTTKERIKQYKRKEIDDSQLTFKDSQSTKEKSMNPFSVVKRPQISASTLEALKQGGGGGFLPGMRICQAMSIKVKKFIPEGQFYVADWKNPEQSVAIGIFGEYEGEEAGRVEALYASWRPAAKLFESNSLIETSYDPEDKIFQQIQNTRKTETTVPQVGTECMFWIPPREIDFTQFDNPKRGLSEADKQTAIDNCKNGLIGIYFYNRSAADLTLAEKVNPGTWVEIHSTLIETKTFSWYNPSAYIKLREATEEDLGAQLLLGQLDSFHNPDSDQELIESSGGGKTVENVAR